MCASRGTPLISKHAKHSCAPEMVPRLPIFHSMVALALNDSANHNNNNDKNKIILKEERKGRRSLVFTTPVIRKLENCTKRAFRRFAVLGFLTEIRQTHSNQPTRLFHFKRTGRSHSYMPTVRDLITSLIPCRERRQQGRGRQEQHSCSPAQQGPQ